MRPSIAGYKKCPIFSGNGAFPPSSSSPSNWLHLPFYFLVCFHLSPTCLCLQTPPLPHLAPMPIILHFLLTHLCLLVQSHIFPFLLILSSSILSPDISSWPKTFCQSIFHQMQVDPIVSLAVFLIIIYWFYGFIYHNATICNMYG